MKIVGEVMEICVVIPFYNAEKYFAEALSSVLAQTLQPKEIIVIIDGCGEKAVCFLERFSGIKVINLPENVGASAARNAGVKAAKADWIAFLDADDQWKPDKLERQREFIVSHPEFSACHTGVEILTKGEITKQYTNKPFDLKIEDLLISSHVTPPSLLINKKSFESVGGFDENIRCSEDYDLSIRLVLAKILIGFCSDPLTIVRREMHNNLSSNSRRYLVGHMQLLIKHWSVFRGSEGAVSKYLYKTFITAGGKSNKVENRLMTLVGKIMKLLSPSLADS